MFRIAVNTETEIFQSEKKVKQIFRDFKLVRLSLNFSLWHYCQYGMGFEKIVYRMFLSSMLMI